MCVESEFLDAEAFLYKNPRDAGALKALAAAAANLEPECAREEQITRSEFLLRGAGP